MARRKALRSPSSCPMPPSFPFCSAVMGGAEARMASHSWRIAQGVVVDFPRHPGPLLVLGREQPLGVGPVHGDIAPLVDHQGDAERGQEYRNGEDSCGEGPPEGRRSGRIGHNMPRARMSEARTSTTAFTWEAEDTTEGCSTTSRRDNGSSAAEEPYQS